MRCFRTSLCLLVGLVALSESASSQEERRRQSRPEDRTSYSVVVVRGVDGKVTLDAVESGKVAHRAKELERDYEAAVAKAKREDTASSPPMKPVLIALCENVKGKRNADRAVQKIRREIHRATGAAADRKPKGQKGKKRTGGKKDQGGGAGGAGDPAGGDAGGWE